MAYTVAGDIETIYAFIYGNGEPPLLLLRVIKRMSI